MTDYTQMTDDELMAVISEADVARAEIARRDRLTYIPRQIAQTLIDLDRDGGNQVDAIVAAFSVAPRDLDPLGAGEGWDDPVIDDTQIAEIIAALQARLDAV